RILGTKLPFDAPPIDPNVQHVGAPPTVQHVGPATSTTRPEQRPVTTTTPDFAPPPEPDGAPPQRLGRGGARSPGGPRRRTCEPGGSRWGAGRKEARR